MFSALTSNAETYYIFVAVIFVALVRIGWRTIANLKGTVFSLARTILYAGIYVTLGVAFSALSFFEGVPYLVALPEIVIVTVAALWSYKYSDRRVSFWKSDGGSLYFRGGIAVYLIYLVGFLTRLSIDITFIGPSMFNFGSIIQLSGPALYASMASDLLLTLGVGLLVGRNVRVARRYNMIQRGAETALSVPMLREVRSA